MKRFLTNKNVEQGISAKYDRKHRFVAKKYKTHSGFLIYLVSNIANNDRLAIPHYLMDRFRALLTHLNKQLMQTANTAIDIDEKLYFKDVDFYRFQYNANTLECLVIIDLMNASRFTICREAVGTMVALLYDEGLDHPSGIFDRIIDYHKLFQFTFNEGSESITSGLSVRRDILIEVADYVPVDNTPKEHVISITTDTRALEENLKQIDEKASKTQYETPREFRRKLGERNSEINYTIDYDTLFSSVPAGSFSAKSASGGSVTHVTKLSCQLPLLAGNIKAHSSKVYKCELSSAQASALREGVLSDRDVEHLLGIEIFTAVYKSGKKLKSFSFPLYYMNVKIEESGRFLHIYPPANGDLYLNHLGLSVFIEKFSKSKKNDPLATFLDTLLYQKIEVDKKLQNISIHRQLPFSEEVFRQTREILIGHHGENGKGGIIEHLDIVGIECDLNAVMLYKADRTPSPLTRALDQDLKTIQRTAHESAAQFYSSLLGKFLNPELHTATDQAKPFMTLSLAPGKPTKSSRLLMKNLNNHDLVMLEGPPGTGKTFTIQNLLIHCLNADKRLLIVSDQKAAIDALIEKLQHYLFDNNADPAMGKVAMNLWNSAIKVIDEVPATGEGLRAWVNKLTDMLLMDLCREQDWPEQQDDAVEKIQQLDAQRLAIEQSIYVLYGERIGQLHSQERHGNEARALSNNEDVADLNAFLAFVGAGDHSKINQSQRYKKHQRLAKKFIDNRRQILNSEYADCYADFQLDNTDIFYLLSFVQLHIKTLEALISKKIRSEAALHELFQSEVESTIYVFLYKHCKARLNAVANSSIFTRLKALFFHPCIRVWRAVLRQLLFQQEFLQAIQNVDNPQQVLRQFQQIHCYLDPRCSEVDYCLAFDICQHLDSSSDTPSVHSQLERLSAIQSERDRWVKLLYLQKLAAIAKRTIQSREAQTNRATQIVNILETLRACNSIDSGSGVPILAELQDALWDSFPIWICRKQAVPFLFPCQANMIDLVIVDEAGQCRVDDALPLLYRAKKLMVVGDDKQTVINKNSVIDDYLFRESQLDEHLRNIQATGVKGGGSNLFELVKSIKQGGVMLDEHYRCPPAIIAYSNQYVYNNELTVMQWQLPQSPATVVVDYSEKFATCNVRASRGRYKGIETDMAERFLTYVAKTIKRIERETKRKVNVETEVAICYFLLKNEPYIKDHKFTFLQRLGGQGDVLDGAGAALQGKERNYIFYLWDINNSNFTFFKQGDEPDKRKGELNVLMSRPKVRAYHYLHKDFERLNHQEASITDFLWSTYRLQNKQRAKSRSPLPSSYLNRAQLPEHRSSGHLIFTVLSYLLAYRSIDIDSVCDAYFNMTIGNTKQKVDLMLVAKNNSNAKPVAVVDLAAFRIGAKPIDDLVDYYFQLRRALPVVEPIVAFAHEIADERSAAYRKIEHLVLKSMLM